MLAATGNEVLPVHDAVVFIGRERIDHVEVLRATHHHHVFESVAQVASIVHMGVGGAAVPALVSHTNHGFEGYGYVSHFACPDLRVLFRRPVLESFHRLETELAYGRLHHELSFSMEDEFARSVSHAHAG